MKTLFQLREKVAIGLVEFTKPYYVQWFKSKQLAWKQNTASLKRFPEGSLGKALGIFLEKNNFKLLPKLEDHDVLHVLLDYKTTITGEINMQFFLLGNRKRSLYALFTALIGTLLVPEKISSFLKAFKKGRKSATISKWDFEHLLAEPLALLKRQVDRQALPNPPFVF